MKIAAALLAILLLAACGQTGPLYLPDEGIKTPVEIRNAPPPAASPAAPAPAAEDKTEEQPQKPPQA